MLNLVAEYAEHCDPLVGNCVSIEPLMPRRLKRLNMCGALPILLYVKEDLSFLLCLQYSKIS